MDALTNIWVWLNNIDTILGVLTAIFSGYAAYRLRKQAKQLRELARTAPRIENFQQLRQAHEGVKSSAPVAFALSLIPTSASIKRSVETLLNAKGWRMPVEELNMNGINSPQDLEDFVNKLREKKRYFEASGFTEIHLFLAGPVQPGTLVGALYDNWIPVKLYHKPTPPPPEVYEYWMPLI
jgi:hypothetical protein